MYWSELEVAAERRRRENPDERRGQSLMNALCCLDKNLYDAIHGTEADCFYIDKRIPAFYARIPYSAGQFPSEAARHKREEERRNFWRDNYLSAVDG